MNLTAHNPNPRPGGDLVQQIEITRQRLRSRRVLLAAGVVLTALIAWLLFGAAIDMLSPLPVTLRVAWFILLALLFVAGISLIPALWLNPPNTQEIARRIEATIPAMHNRLVTVLDLRTRPAPAEPMQQSFEQQLIEQTRQRLADYHADRIADPRPTRQALLAAAATIALAAIMLLLLQNRMPTAIARLLAPMADIAPITSVAFRADPGDLEAMAGDPVTLIAEIQRGETDALLVQLRSATPSQSAESDWHPYPMQRGGDGRFTFTLTELDRSYDYRIRGGGTWSPIHRITLIHRPVIESITAIIHLPDYMGPASPIRIESPTAITAPIGSTLELSASARGSVTRGQVQRMEQIATESPQTIEEETLWFDDALPADAQTIGQWHWLSEPVRFGSRSHTFSSVNSSHGFRSRLSPLLLSAGSSFILYARIEPADAPSRLTVSLCDDRTWFDLIWGAPPLTSPKEREGLPVRSIRVAALPHAEVEASSTDMRWIRLEASVERFLGAKLREPVKITTIVFEANDGSIILDGAGRAIRRVESSMSRRPERPDHPDRSDQHVAWQMSRAEDGAWSARLPVMGDALLSVQLTGPQGHASRAMSPISLTARPDLAPTLLIEKPSRTVILSQMQPVPLSVRVFDDLGLSATGIQLSHDPDRFTAAVQWIDTFATPATHHLMETSIEPKDAQGQPLKAGDVYFVRAVARDRKGQMAISETIHVAFVMDDATPGPSADDQSKELSRWLEEWRKLAESHRAASDDAAKLLTDLPDRLRESVPRNDEGEAMARSEVGRLMQQWFSGLDEPKQQALRELNDRLLSQRKEAAKFAQQMEAQANHAQNSPAASSLEDEVLRQLAAAARALAQPDEPDAAEAAAMLERLRQLQALSAEQRESLAKVQQHLSSLHKAREHHDRDPGMARQSFEDLLAQLHALGATRELQQLADALREKQRDLAALARRQEELNQRSASPLDSKAMQEAGSQQKKQDERAAQAMQQADAILRKERDRKDSLEPWNPQAQESADAQQQRMREHQTKGSRELAASRRDVSDAREQAMQLTQSLRRTAAQMDAESSAASDARGQMQSLLTSASMKTLMSMAGRAKLQSMENREAQLAGERADPTNPGIAAGEQNHPLLRRGDVLPSAEAAPLPFDPSLGPAIYRLPPHLREALLQGMSEQGPSSYQRLIDAYHRKLTETAGD